MNGNLDQGMNELTGFGGWASIGSSTQGTGVAHLGVKTAVSKGVQVTFESWVFHDRAPFRGAQSFVYNMTTMSDSAFHHQKDLTKLDSNMQKITIEFPSTVGSDEKNIVYMNTGSFNGQRSFSGGAIFKVTPRISVQVDATTGRKDYVDYAIMEAIMFKATDNLTLFVSNENAGGIKSSYYQASPNVPANQGRVSFGANYKLLSGNLRGGLLKYSLDVNGGVALNYQRDGLYNDNFTQFFVGTRGVIEFN